MSETASTEEPATGPIENTAHTTSNRTPTVVEERDVKRRDRGGKLHVIASWVGIVAGTVFVIAVIFFTGFVLGAHAGGGHGGHHGGHHRDGGGQMDRAGGGPRHGWQGGPGGFGPGSQG
nr:hypothetical protein [Actinomycetota bacterium]